MIYITVKLPKMYHQMSFEEFLFGNDTEDFRSYVRNSKETATRTYEVNEVKEKFLRKVNPYFLIEKLHKFNEAHKDLFEVTNRSELYNTFYIPKKSGGLRKIDAPDEKLKNALRELKTIFEEDFGALYHTNAFAYIKGRCTIDAVKKHQENNSQWYGKYDLSNFFGSTTPDYVIKMLRMVFPFNLVLASQEGEKEFRQAIDLAFLDGGLPQGTPISPIITNLIMIPVDYKLANTLRHYKKTEYIYTRYADDFIISSKYNFNFREIEKVIVDTLAEFEAPFNLNSKKTRYGSRAGRNWELGVLVNKDNQITVGTKKKKQFQTMLFNYAMDYKNGISWPKEDVQHMEGLRSYYRMVEGETIDNIVAHISAKVGLDIIYQIKIDLGRDI